MSLRPENIFPVPLQTAQVAQAAFPQGNRYMSLRDKLGTIYEDVLFDDLFSKPDEYYLPHSQQKRLAYARQIGQDGLELMDRIETDPQATLLWQLPAIDILRRIGFSGPPPRQFRIVDGQFIWRVENQDELPPSAQLISSPYDLQARYSRKHAHCWVGYKVHLSENCDESQPHLITQVATAISTSPDIEALPQIHQGLADKSLLPSQHLVDTGYVSAQMLVESREIYQLDSVGPARQDFK